MIPKRIFILTIIVLLLLLSSSTLFLLNIIKKQEEALLKSNAIIQDWNDMSLRKINRIFKEEKISKPKDILIINKLSNYESRFLTITKSKDDILRKINNQISLNDSINQLKANFSYCVSEISSNILHLCKPIDTIFNKGDSLIYQIHLSYEYSLKNNNWITTGFSDSSKIKQINNNTYIYKDIVTATNNSNTNKYLFFFLKDLSRNKNDTLVIPIKYTIRDK